MSALLNMNNVRKTFALPGQFSSGAGCVRAVDGVDLRVMEGEHLGLVGGSGSGKSTLARLMVKLYQPDSGDIFIDGCPTARLSQARFRPHRRKIQMVFQDPYSSLDPRFTVRKILKEAMALLPGKMNRAEQDDLACRMLVKAGLDADALPRFPHEFSGGERQRIAIARALIMRPKLLILDEAVSALDVLIQAQIITLLKELQKEFGVTYIFITHNLQAARRLCHRIAVMYQGKIVETAPTEELFSNPLHPYTRRLLEAALNYKASDESAGIFLTENSHLIDKGGGHFVIN